MKHILALACAVALCAPWSTQAASLGYCSNNGPTVQPGTQPLLGKSVTTVEPAAGANTRSRIYLRVQGAPLAATQYVYLTFDGQDPSLTAPGDYQLDATHSELIFDAKTDSIVPQGPIRAYNNGGPVYLTCQVVGG